ncbi:MAG: uracil-DNA glycosylase [Frankiaceae bacterium]|nr:uracil-DNA glycosylase [Frankiaceae bacterium]MDX6273683.1 uracil-DNA glycosylase [Frankiales bacterium]
MTVPPGSEHPAEVATKQTPVAHAAEDVQRIAAQAVRAEHLDARVSVCRACPRLVEWREQVAEEKRASFANEVYWGRPVPSWGEQRARVVIVGLAPAAHGGNRTGRIFTGDRSGDFLYAGLHRAGLAAKPTSDRAGDGQRLIDTRILAAVHCAPPANKPTPAERDACRPWLVRDLELLAPTVRVLIALGAFAWESAWPALRTAGYTVPAQVPKFGHGVEALGQAPGRPRADDAVVLLGCFHPSQQNTFTGRMTPDMLDQLLSRVSVLARR